MTSTTELLRLRVPCDVNAPKAVRRALTALHDGNWPLEDGVLVASELVTNAIQHSGCTGTESLDVDVGRGRDGNLVISVHDPGLSGHNAEPVDAQHADPGGRGLQIVERLSVRWGSERPDGYRVWAEIPAGSERY